MTQLAESKAIRRMPAAKGRASLMDGWADTLHLAIPLMAAQIAIIALGFADTLAFGRLGVEALAGGGLAVAVFSFVHIVCVGVLMAVGNQVAWMRGAGDREGIRDAVASGLVIAFAFGGAATFLLALLEPALIGVGQGPELAAAAMAYLQLAAIGLVPSLVFTVLRGLSTGLGVSGPIATITVLAVICKVVFNAVIIVGVEDELTALAWLGLGTAVTYGLMAVSMFAYCRRRFGGYVSWPGRTPAFTSTIRETLRLGIPIGATYGVEAGFFTAVALIVGGLGQVSLAAHHIANQWVYLTFMIAVGLSHATAVRVGQAAGKGRYDEARRLGLQGCAMGLMAMTATAALFALFGRTLAVSLVGPSVDGSQEVVDLAVGLLLVAAAFQWVDGLQNIAMGSLRGLKDPASTTVAAVAGFWLVGLPAAWVFAGYVKPGAICAWLGLALGLVVTAAILLARFHHVTYEGATRSHAFAASEGR